MSGAPFTEKLVAASADTDASKAARARLTAVLAKLDPAGGIPDNGDGTGRHANKDKKQTAETAKPATARSATPGAPLDPVAAERAAKFDQLDKARTGKLTREYYTANHSDTVAAGGRFEKMDTNKDGLVTRDEYISNGKQQK